jgi:CubicO group peptidase (beta-lactamase class C family)
MRILFFIYCVFFSSISCYAQDSLSSKVDGVFEQYAHPSTPGLALLVIKEGKVIYKRGYGMADLEHAIPITPESVFELGSFSKQFTAFCALLMANRGLISLDDDVHKYIPELRDFGHEIKIIHLITHTSGLRDIWTLFYLAGLDLENYYPTGMVFDMINRQRKLNFNPGDEFLYSNTGYFLLTQIIERVSGKSLRRFAEENIFKPLGMIHTHFHDNYTELVPGRAFGYDKTDSGYRWNVSFNTMVGAGRLYSTVGDLYLWDQHFYNNTLGGGPALIDKEYEPFIFNNGKKSHYAFGLFTGEYQGMKTVEHGGAWAGYRTDILRFPDQQFSVICLSNCSDFRGEIAAKKIAAIYLHLKMDSALYMNVPVAATKPASLRTTADKIPARIAGTYYSDELNVKYILSVKDDSLQVQPGYGKPYMTVHSADSLFTYGTINLKIKTAASGEFTGFVLDAGRVTGIEFYRK